MNKILILASVSILTINVAVAYPGPGVDMSVGAMPFQLLQQQSFQKMEMSDYKQFKDAFDAPAELRTESPQQLQEEYKIKNLMQPTKIELGKKRTELPPTEKELPLHNQLIQQDGKIYIKHYND